MNSVASSITSESFSHRGAAPVVVKSSDGQIRVQTHIKSRIGLQIPVHENTRFQSGNHASLLAAVSLASLMGATAVHAQQAGQQLPTRSEERRVGKEGRSRWARAAQSEKW